MLRIPNILICVVAVVFNVFSPYKSSLPESKLRRVVLTLHQITTPVADTVKLG
jgi:hypothetical protein